MSTQRLRIIVSGLIAQYPLGGVSWDYLQFPAGLARLGHDVYYLEDTGLWPYNPLEGGTSSHCDFNVRYLREVMESFGLEERWAYRFPWQSQWFGMEDSRRKDVIATADLLINVSFSLGKPAEYRTVRRLACIDSDPVFTQVKLARGQADFRTIVDAHDVHFSFGEHLTDNIPATGHCWRPTRQPVLMTDWATSREPRQVFTTVMNWSSYNPVTYKGQTYGQKDVEFAPYFNLPQRVHPSILELAVNPDGKAGPTPIQELKRNNWQLVDPMAVCPDVTSYRDYIQASLAEWSVAKNGYVVGQPGWFSCRSACYLAAGRPVVVQDTGFSSILPVGEGLIPFSNPDEAAAGIASVEADYQGHSRAARDVAQEYFDSQKVLSRLVEDAMTAAIVPSHAATALSRGHINSSRPSTPECH